jgi:hypothetical protein
MVTLDKKTHIRAALEAALDHAASLEPSPTRGTDIYYICVGVETIINETAKVFGSGLYDLQVRADELVNN